MKNTLKMLQNNAVGQKKGEMAQTNKKYRTTLLKLGQCKIKDRGTLFLRESNFSSVF